MKDREYRELHKRIDTLARGRVAPHVQSFIDSCDQGAYESIFKYCFTKDDILEAYEAYAEDIEVDA